MAVGLHHKRHYGVRESSYMCGSACVDPTPAQAHCRGCHRTFGSVSGFDRHRRGGACLDPAGLGMVETRGVWRTPMSDAARSRRFPVAGASVGGRTAAVGVPVGADAVGAGPAVACRDVAA